jgi:hypothetical protein
METLFNSRGTSGIAPEPFPQLWQKDPLWQPVLIRHAIHSAWKA